MARLGISVYPEHSTEEKDMEYIRKAGRLGYKRIFTCLLSVEESREEVIGRFRRLADEAHACGMEIIPDVSLPYSPGWESPTKTYPYFRKCMWMASVWTKALMA